MDPETEYLSNITYCLTPSTLRFDDGDVVIRLSRHPEDTMVLHSSVLKAASNHFKARLGGRWGDISDDTVTHPTTGTTIPIYKPRMVLIDDTFILTDYVSLPVTGEESTLALTSIQRDSSSSIIDTNRSIPRFHNSSLAAGFSASTTRHLNADCVRRESIDLHKMLFNLLYDQTFDFPERDSVRETSYSGSRITAELLQALVGLAEYYDVAAAIAPLLVNVIINIGGIRTHISEEPLRYLILGNKLRSPELFAEALRHFVGQGHSYNSFRLLGAFTKTEAVMSVLPAKWCLDYRIAEVVEAIQAESLPRYTTNTHRSRRHQEGPFRTTFLLSSFDQFKTMRDKCDWIASSIVREWLAQQQVGANHWSHVKFGLTNRVDGFVKASFREGCEAIMDAAEDPDAIDLEKIGNRLASRHANLLGIQREPGSRYSPAQMIAYQLRYLIGRARQPTQRSFFYDRSQWPDRCSCQGDHRPAVHSYGLDYFTDAGICEEDMPWKRQEEWPSFRMPAVNIQPASAAWLHALKVESSE